MLDLRVIRRNPESIGRALARKGVAADLAGLLELDAEHRRLETEFQTLRHDHRAASRRRSAPGLVDRESAQRHARAVAERIDELHQAIRTVARQLADALMAMPNLPDAAVPEEPPGRIVRTAGELRRWDFAPRSHWEIAAELRLLDFGRAARLAGPAFPLYVGLGAQLERALIQWMLDVHVGDHGYLEVIPPYLARRSTLVNTGQLPIHEANMYRVEPDDLFLIPTAEVPLTNLYQGETLRSTDLPVRLVAATPCFRREAGGSGRETRGLVRMHQFHKVELVQLRPADPPGEGLAAILGHASSILDRLAIPYRVRDLPAAELSFAAARTYDLEAYAPGLDRWLEVSSCTEFGDFQARRAAIRVKSAGGRPQFVHTANGSGLATPRTLACLLENYQQRDGTVRVPSVLQPYLHGRTQLTGP